MKAVPRFPFDHLTQAEVVEFEKLLPQSYNAFACGPRAERTRRAKRFSELLARRYAPPPDPPEAA